MSTIFKHILLKINSCTHELVNFFALRISVKIIKDDSIYIWAIDFTYFRKLRILFKILIQRNTWNKQLYKKVHL